ncbi:MAG: transporter substrate-binding domain-containing protein [Clostridia bacterium]|nr:transporter substrate-binding domain-containing protein [Clostridia bacterium]
MGKLKNIDAKAAEKGSGLETIWQFVKFIFVSLLAMIVQFALLNILKVVPPLSTMFKEAQAGASIVLSLKDEEVKSEDALSGITVGVSADLAETLKAKYPAADFVVCSSDEEAAEKLKSGEVRCAVVDFKTAESFMKENKKTYTKYQLPNETYDFHWLGIFFCAAEIGGLAYFIINNTANIVAQIVSFFVNREKTFNSGANVAITLPIYIVFTIALIAFSAWLNPTLKNLFVGSYNMGDDLAANAATMVCSAVQFFLYFPVDKILFHKKKEEPVQKAEA